MDEAVFWVNRSLSASDIDTLYQCGVSGLAFPSCTVITSSNSTLIITIKNLYDGTQLGNSSKYNITWKLNSTKFATLKGNPVTFTGANFGNNFNIANKTANITFQGAGFVSRTWQMLNTTTKTIQSTRTAYNGLITLVGNRSMNAGSVTTFNVTSGSYYNSTSTTSLTIPFKAGIRNFTAMSSGLVTINLYGTTFLNRTNYNINLRFGDALLNLTAKVFNTSTKINPFSFRILALNSTYLLNQNYTSQYGYKELYVKKGVTFNLTSNTSGYAIEKYQTKAQTLSNNYTMKMHTTNSVTFYFYKLIDGSMLGNVINITLQSPTYTRYYFGRNGSKYIDNLSASTHTGTFSAVGYDSTQTYITIAPSSYQVSKIYLQPAGNDIDFQARDFQTNNPIPNIVFTFYMLINGTSMSVRQATTDFSGYIRVKLVPTLHYSFIASGSGYDVFYGNVTPSQSSYSVLLTTTGSGIFQSIWHDISETDWINYNVNSNYAEGRLLLSSNSGNLQYYGIKAVSYHWGGTPCNLTLNPKSNITGLPSGSLVILNLTGISNCTGNNLTFTYYFKVQNHSLILWNKTLLLMNYNPLNTTFEGIAAQVQQQSNGVKFFIGMFILILFAVGGMLLGKGKIAVGIICAMFGIAVNMKFGFFNAIFGIISLVILGLMLIADSRLGSEM